MSDVTAKFTVNPRKAIETEFRIDATILDHDKLYNRDLPDQHPMSAITGLVEAFDEKQDILTSANAGTGISIETVGGVVKINNTQNSAEWGQIDGDINQQTDLKTALDNKQDELTQTQLEAVNSGANTTNIGQIATNTSDIADINALIPNQATTSNQLADQGFVNSSIATNTAYFIGTFNSVAELEAYSGTLTNNDYAFVATTDSAGNTLYDRYKYNADTQQWIFEYELNNSSFTASQWASINSGATTANIAKISTNETTINNHIENTSNPHSVTKAQVGLGNVDNTSDLNKPISTATQTALNGKQATLVSGTNIKTVNNQSLLGSGNITIGGAVDSVNGQTGAVVLTASDVGALPDSTVIPTEATVSGWGFTKNVGTVTSVNNTSPDGNGNVTLSIPAAQVNSDWNAVSGVAQILNKPSLATVATSGLYSDLSGTPTIPTVNNSTITLTQGGVTKGSFTLNQSSGTIIDFDVGGGSSYTAGTNINITNDVISTTATKITFLEL